MIGAATNNSRAKPAESRTGCGNVGFAIDLPGAIRSQELSIEQAAQFPANACAAMLEVVRPEMFFVVSCRIQRRTGFKHYDVEPAFGEYFGGGAASSAGSNNTNVI